MTRIRGLAFRIAAAAALGVVAGIALQLAGPIPRLIWFAFNHATATFDIANADDMARCRRDPASWELGDGERFRGFAYDPITGLSDNAQAPPLDGILALRRAAGEEDPVRFVATGRWGVMLLLERGEGPCGLVQLQVQRADGARTAGLRWMTAGISAATTLAVLLASFLAIRPTIRRVATLEQGARDLGTERYRSPVDGDGDALDVLAQVLDRAHERILADQDIRERRRRAMERHLDDVAHDLRTPLAALQLLLEETAGRVPEARERLGQALEEVTYLSLLTENLAVAARLDDGEGEGGARCEAAEVVRRVAARFARIGERAGVEVMGAWPERELWIGAPPVPFEQAVANLVHNAVVHNGPGGHVLVALEADGEGFRLLVVDDGPGVDDEQVPRLMERSWRGDVAARDEPRGRGLGLAIAGEVFRRAGWQVSFEAEDPSGLRITVTGARVPAPEGGRPPGPVAS